MAKRFNVRVSDELDASITKYSLEFAVTKSQFAGMCIQAGLGAILRAVKPEESIDTDTWAKIILAVENSKGMKTDEISGKQ